MKKYAMLLILISTFFSAIAQWSYVGPAGISNEWTVDNNIKIDTSGSPVIVFFENVFAYKASCLRFNGTQWGQMGKETFDIFKIETLLDFEIDNKNNYYILYIDNEYRTSCIRFNGDKWAYAGSQYIVTEYSPYQSLAIDTAGIVYVALQSQSGFSIVKEIDDSWIPVTIKGLEEVVHYFDLVFDNDNIAFIGYCGMNGKEPNCAKLVNDNWETIGSPVSSAYFVAETHLHITKDHQIYIGFGHQEMGFYKFDNQYNKWIKIETSGFGEFFAGVTNIVSDSNSNIYVSIQSDKARCFTYNGLSWHQLNNSVISESEAGYPNIAINKDDILFATYNDWISGKAVVKKYDKNTGIENAIHDDLLKVFPNPVKNRFYIELTGQKFTVMISDAKGKIVLKEAEGFNKIEIDANAFGKGMFIVRGRCGDGTFYYRKFIVL